MDLRGVTAFQKLWRSKRVFENSQGGLKFSASSLTAKIATFKLPTNFRAVFETDPKGFSEITGYTASFKKPVIRWVSGQGWIGDADGVTKLIAKRGQQTIVMTDKYFEVLGLGNYEEALLAIVKNGWAPKLLLKAAPTYKKIDGIFYVNMPIVLTDLKDELKKLPSAMVTSVTYNPELKMGVPAVVLKLAKPKWTYQFFKNGTVLFTGIKDPSEREAPRMLFKEFFTTYDLYPLLAFNMAASPAIKRPNKGGNSEAKKAKLAGRYPLASSWNSKPPQGFYVRPGTNGKPRLYKWRKMERNITTREMLNRGAMGLSKKNAVVVAKAYAAVGVNVPAHTLKIFRNMGIPIVNTEREATGTPAGLKNRRAPSWNSTKPGYYVRPGPGKQPYWFAIPSGLASGRKTVIKTYTDAGRNIPAAVRDIFKIGANVKTNVVAVGANEFTPGLQHVVTMGLNRVLRINDRQATRLTKAELLGVARNMGIPEANSKMVPSTLIDLIQKKAGVSNKPNRTYDVLVNGMYYSFLNNGRVARVTSEGIQTQRAWATMPIAERNKIAKKLLPSNLHAEYNAMPVNNKFNALRGMVGNRKAAVAKAKANANAASKALAKATENAKAKANAKARENEAKENAELDAMAMRMELNMRMTQNLGAVYEKNNVNKFMKIYNKIPVGARGKPLKANIERTYKQFVQNAYTFRGQEKPKKERAPKNQSLNYVYNIPRNAVNFSNKLESLGLNSSRNWTWNEIRAALKGKASASLKAMWQSNVVARVPIGAVGPIKRKVPRRT